MLNINEYIHQMNEYMGNPGIRLQYQFFLSHITHIRLCSSSHQVWSQQVLTFTVYVLNIFVRPTQWSETIWAAFSVALNLLDIPSDSILKPEMSSPETLSPSAPTPRPRGPMMEFLRRSWISSEIISRFLRAVLYSPLAWDSLACRSSTFFFRFWRGDDQRERRVTMKVMDDRHQHVFQCSFS